MARRRPFRVRRGSHVITVHATSTAEARTAAMLSLNSRLKQFEVDHSQPYDVLLKKVNRHFLGR